MLVSVDTSETAARVVGAIDGANVLTPCGGVGPIVSTGDVVVGAIVGANAVVVGATVNTGFCEGASDVDGFCVGASDVDGAQEIDGAGVAGWMVGP